MRSLRTLSLLPAALLLSHTSATVYSKDIKFDPRYTGTDCGGDLDAYFYEPQTEFEKNWFIINFQVSTVKTASSLVSYSKGVDKKARTKKCSIWAHFYNTADEEIEMSFEPWIFTVAGISLDKGLVMKATAKPYFEFQREDAKEPPIGEIPGPFGPKWSTSFSLRDTVKPGPGYSTGYGLDKKNVKQNTFKVDITLSIEEDDANTADEAKLEGRIGETSSMALLLHTGMNIKEGCSRETRLLPGNRGRCT